MGSERLHRGLLGSTSMVKGGTTVRHTPRCTTRLARRRDEHVDAMYLLKCICWLGHVLLRRTGCAVRPVLSARSF
jgi:hypothetical protein